MRDYWEHLFDRRAGPLAQDLGRVVHWHED